MFPNQTEQNFAKNFEDVAFFIREVYKKTVPKPDLNLVSERVETAEGKKINKVLLKVMTPYMYIL